MSLLETAQRITFIINSALREEYEGDIEKAISAWQSAAAEAKLLAGELAERKLDAEMVAEKEMT